VSTSSNSLDDAASYARPLFEQLLQNCAKAGIPCRIVDIIRTPSQQEQKLKDKVSWTEHSKHLPQPPEQKSEAIDIVPLAILSEHKPDWDPTNVLWQKIGAIGQATGLLWGGTWKHLNNGLGDPSHFEYIHKEPDVQVSNS
jgi:hypothetical protein